jgi:hypothetical protein
MKTPPTVRLIYLDSKTDGSKVGFDDFFAAGHTVQELIARATITLRPGPDPEPEFPYKETPHGLTWLKPTKDGTVETLLCNFTARITSDLVEDDGVETKRAFEIEATQGRRKATIKLPAERFFSMNWPAEALGSHAILAPGTLMKDHARTAIQLFSQDAGERHVYTHLGWRKINDCWYYLHAGGAIGPDGAEASIEVAVPSALERYALPDPPDGEDLKTAIRASLHLLDVAPHQITFPLLSAVYRAPLGESDLSVHLCGPTGEGKSELAARLQQHHGTELDARHLPGSWSSTGNSLEGLAFTAKDAVLTVDDFAPTGSTADVQRFHKEADRLLRAQGNRAGRQRMRSDATLKAAKPPRGLIVSTGEDIPKGQSLRSRMFILEVSPGDVDWTTMSVCQEHAAQGLYAQALAGFVQWLALRCDTIKDGLRTEIAKLRQYTHATHKRTPDIVANLAVGFWYFLRFALEFEAITKNECEDLWERCWQALTDAAAAQATHQRASEPARRFLELLTAALANGKAHVASHTGAFPADAEAWGWRMESAEHGWQSKGARVGWLNESDLYLEPDAAFASAQELAKSQGDSLPVTPQTLRKRLKEHGYLASVDTARETLTIRRNLEGKQRDVLHLHKNIFLNGLPSYKKPDKPDSDPEQAGDEAKTEDNVGFSGSQKQAKLDKPDGGPTQESHEKSNVYEANVGNVGFSVGRESVHAENNGRAHFRWKPHVGNVRFSENQNPTSGEKNPKQEQ